MGIKFESRIVGNSVYVDVIYDGPVGSSVNIALSGSFIVTAGRFGGFRVNGSGATSSSSSQVNSTGTFSISGSIAANSATLGSFVFGVTSDGSVDMNFSNVQVNGAAQSYIDHAPYNYVIVTNAPPAFLADSQTISGKEDTPLSISVKATDPDGDQIDYTVSSQPTNGQVTGGAGGIFTYTPRADFNGSDSFVVNASDGKGGVAKQTINLNLSPVNDAPTFSTSSQSVIASAGIAKTISLSATDVDGDALTYTVNTPSKGSATISGGLLTYTPTSSATGTDSFTVTASDGKGGTATQVIAATIAAPSSDVTFLSASSYNSGSFARSVNTGNINLDKNIDVVVANEFSGTVSLFTGDGTGKLNFVKELSAGNSPISVALGDFNGDGVDDIVTASGSTNVVTVLMSSGPANYLPIKTIQTGQGHGESAIFDVNKDGLLDLVVASTSGSVSVSLNDGKGWFSAVKNYSTAPGSGTIAAADFNNDGWIDIATSNYPASVTILYNNKNGGFAEGKLINNGAWALGAGRLNSDVYPDLVSAVGGSNTISVDLNNGNGSFSATSYAAGSRPGYVVLRDLNGDGYDDVLVANQGSNEFRFLINNGSGALLAAQAVSIPSMAYSLAVADLNNDGRPDVITANAAANSISVFIQKNTNSAPSFSSAVQLISTNEDTSRSITLTATDADGDALIYSVSSSASNGIASLSGNTVIYTPRPNFNGTDNLVVRVSDGKGGAATQTINVTVVPVNDAPTFSASSQSLIANAGAAQTFTLAATDVDGDALTYTTVTPSKGSATISGSILTYTPSSSATGTDSFTVTASDGKGGTATQTISVTISAATAAQTFQLSTPDGWVGSVGGNGNVVGTSGFQDVRITSGSVSLDGSFNTGNDIVRLDGNASGYSIVRSGSSATISKGSSASLTVPIGTTGAPIVFDDGPRKLVFSNSNFNFGSQTFSTTQSAITAGSDGTALPTGASASAVATAILAGTSLSSGQTSHISIAGTAKIVGTSVNEVVQVISSAKSNLTFDPSFNQGGDVIVLGRDAGSFTAQRSSSSMLLVGPNENLTIPIGTAGLTLRFTDGDRTLIFSNGEFKIGTQSIGTTAIQLTGSTTTTSIDAGTAASPVTLNASTGAVNFTDNAAVETNVRITGFGADDRITVTGATSSRYSFTTVNTDGNSTADLVITFNNTTASVVNSITLVEAVSANAFVSDYATAQAAIGNASFMVFG